MQDYMFCNFGCPLTLFPESRHSFCSHSLIPRARFNEEGTGGKAWAQRHCACPCSLPDPDCGPVSVHLPQVKLNPREASSVKEPPPTKGRLSGFSLWGMQERKVPRVSGRERSAGQTGRGTLVWSSESTPVPGAAASLSVGAQTVLIK